MAELRNIQSVDIHEVLPKEIIEENRFQSNKHASRRA